MKLVRFLALAAAAAAVVLLVAAVMAFNPSFQTYAARRVLAARPELRATLESVSAGLKHVELRQLRLEQGGAVITIPLLEADLPILNAALSDTLNVSRLVARGWTIDLSRPTTEPAAGAAAPMTPVDAAAAAAGVFTGVFSHLQLPVDLALDGVRLEGDVILPESRGRVKVAIQGGGLEAGREGQFTLKAEAALADPAVNRLRVDSTIAATLDTPRTLSRLVAKLDAEASGTQFPNGVKLAADLSASRATLGESYRAALVSQGRQLVLLSAEFPAHARRLDGTWKLDMRDTDVTPFALGQPLPLFSLAGEGAFDTDAALTGLHVSGRIGGNADRLSALAPGLTAVGPIKLNADFDLAQRSGVVAVERLDASIATAQPVATVRTLQAFEFNPATGALKAAVPARDLLDVSLQGVPVSWLAPFVKDIAISGGELRGEVVMTSRGGGMTLRAKTPLTVDKLAASRAGQGLFTGVDGSLNVSADYTPQGWQMEISGLTLKSDRGQLLGVEAKAGKLAGRDQPYKATGTISASLPVLLGQPMARELPALSGGEATVEFAASIAAKTEVQARIAVKDLGVTGGADAEKLPSLQADVRADLAADGQLTLNVPITLERNGRVSDLTLAGTLAPAKDHRRIEGQLVSTQLFVDDTKLLAALLPAKAEAKPAEEKSQREALPAWAGLSGSLGVQLKKVIYGELFQATNIGGTIRIEGGALKLEQFQAGLGEGGEAKLSAAVTFQKAAAQPYALDAALAVSDFNPAPLLQAISPGHPATVEGRFNVNSKLSGRAATLGELALGAVGDFQLTSRGGTFRGIPVNVATKLETTSSFAAGIAKLGSLASAIGGKNDKAIETIANRAQAVAEVVSYWKAIPYDQLSVTLTRDAGLSTALKDFTLISPEVRLSGSGVATHRGGTPVVDDALQMEFKLRARGHHAELLKYLGVLEDTADELGYVPSGLPLKVAGTLGKPDTSELNSQLAAIALEKSGVSDKAVELFNRLRGATR